METNLGRVTLAVVMTWLIMMMVPFPVYGGMAALGLADVPEQDSPGQFFLGVAVQKIGVALGFVLLFVLVKPVGTGGAMRYAAIWWIMYAIVETGQGIGPGYTRGDALGGIIAEAIYFPLSALFVRRVLGGTAAAS
jgi:hypothetical protein